MGAHAHWHMPSLQELVPQASGCPLQAHTTLGAQGPLQGLVKACNYAGPKEI